MQDVITIGSATRDVFLISKNFKIVKSEKFATGAAECVALGAKIEVEDLYLTTGGGGTNAAATFAALGLKAAAAIRVGDDGSGRDVIDDLKKFKVNTSLVKIIKGGATGYSTLLTTTAGERSVLVHRGVSGKFTDKDFTWSRMQAKWFYMSSLSGNLALALRLARFAKAQGTLTVFNPGTTELAQGINALTPIMKNLTLLNLNTQEAQLLTKLNTRDFKLLFQKIALPGLMVVITDGPNGAYAHLDGTTWFARPHGFKPISRTGAGDAFGSALTAALIEGRGIDEALQIGTLNAESVIRSYGAKHGILKKWPTKSQMKQIKIRQLT